MPLTEQEAVELLGHRLSSQRRRGATRLRRLADPATAPAVRAALRREVDDPRTWETQYQLVMALAMTGSRADAPFLRELALRPHEATMVDTALGDAVVRLDRDHEHDARPVLWCLEQDADLLADGALRAVAVLRLTFTDDVTRALLERVDREPDDSPLRFWPAVACAGWTGDRVREFLHACAAGPRDDVAEAARASLAGRFLRVSVL